MDKKLTLTAVFGEKFIDEAVEAAKVLLPTWKVVVTDIDSQEAHYKAKVGCRNCRNIWIGRFPYGTPIPPMLTCPLCGCNSRNTGEVHNG